MNYAIMKYFFLENVLFIQEFLSMYTKNIALGSLDAYVYNI